MSVSFRYLRSGKSAVDQSNQSSLSTPTNEIHSLIPRGLFQYGGWVHLTLFIFVNFCRILCRNWYLISISDIDLYQDDGDENADDGKFA